MGTVTIEDTTALEIVEALRQMSGDSVSRIAAVCRDLANELESEMERQLSAPEDYPEDSMTDAEADADTLKSAGMGTDEDYGFFGDDDTGYN